MEEIYEAAGAALNREVLALRIEELSDFLTRRASALVTEPRPFAAFMRRKLREKGILRQNLFLEANLSESYGYKLLCEEKHTRQRDVILRLCLAARFRPAEVQEALLLYGMAPLYARFPRDAVLLAVFQNGIWEPERVQTLLRELGLAPLSESTIK